MKIKNGFLSLVLLLGVPLFVSPPIWAIDRSTLDIRTLQTRDFPQVNKEKAFYAALATFQDLGFVISETSYPLGLIEANQTHSNEFYIIRATLTLNPSTSMQNTITARLSLNYYPFLAGEEGTNFLESYPRQAKMILDPVSYQQFFEAFSYSLQPKISQP